MSADTARRPLLHTPLHALHLELGARMVPFAGYAMPVQYPAGILAEHRQCRHEAALFDVSHMGQLLLKGPDAAAALETLVPVDVIDLPLNKQRYALFTNAQGGLLDDLMITHREDGLFVIVNAACKDADLRAPARPHRQPLRDRHDVRPRAAGAAGPDGRARDRAPVARHREAHVHDRRLLRRRRRRLLRHPLGLHRRGRLRDLRGRRRRRHAGPHAAGPARGQARRPGRARLAAPRGRPVPVRPRHRHHHHAGRGRAHLGDPEGAPPGRRARRRLSRRGRHRQAARPSAR